MSIASDMLRGYHDLMILSLLTEHESYGYEISRKIREVTKEQYIIKETTLYSAFNRLEKSGSISSFFQEGSLGRPRTYYRITEKGKDDYKQMCSVWSDVQWIVDQFVKEA